MYAVIDGNFPNDLDSASILSNIIGHKLSDGSRGDLYLRCRTNFANDTLQSQAPHFMNMGILAINILNESGVYGTPSTRILRLTDVYHLSAPYNVFGESTAVGISVAKSDHNYNYKTGFEI